MENTIRLFRTARTWSNTTVVSIPSESCDQLGIEDGTPLRIQIETVEGDN